MRFLVLAHGDGRRWVDAAGVPYLGHPKHFIRVDGETLLERVVRMALPHGEVVVVGPDDRYDVPGASRVSLDGINACGSDMGKFLDTRHLWSQDRTVLLWGDCFYTDEAMATIAGHRSDDYHVFRRPGPSALTGARWDESFAVSFGAHEHQRVTETAEHLAAMVVARRLKATHIRTHLAAMCGARNVDDVNATASLPNQTHIDDRSDDFDSPAEWRGWMGRHYADRYRLAVCVPWTGGDTWRQRSLEWCLDYWRGLGLPVFVGADTTGGRWPNRSAARNDAVRQARATGDWECLFLADSDTFVRPDQLWAAAHLSVERTQLVLAFTDYLRIAERESSLLLDGQVPEAKWSRTARRRATVWKSHASGAVMVPADVWDSVGGFDERFLSWGGEDRAFWLACNTIHGQADRIDGPAWHWWHPKAADKQRTMPQYLANIDLGLRYKVAAAWTGKAGALPAVECPPVADPDAIRAILAEPGGPLGEMVPIDEVAP